MPELGQEQLTDPSITLKRIDDLLATPDEQGRFLPLVEFQVDNIDPLTDFSYLATSDVTDQTDEVIGTITTYIDHKFLVEFFEDIRVDERGDGYGPAVYLKAIARALRRRQPHDFRTDTMHQSTDAVKAWRRLASQSIAQAVNEFEPSEKATGCWNGYYVVNGNNRPKVSKK